MTTKFSPILKVKNLDVEKLENEIAKLNNQKKTIQSDIQILKDELKNSFLPKNGTINQLKQNYFTNNIIKENIKLKLENIDFLDEQIKSNELLLKKAMLEYEKMKHLHQVEERKILEKIKKQEAKDLDEIGTLLFTINKEES